VHFLQIAILSHWFHNSAFYFQSHLFNYKLSSKELEKMTATAKKVHDEVLVKRGMMSHLHRTFQVTKHLTVYVHVNVGYMGLTHCFDVFRIFSVVFLCFFLRGFRCFSAVFVVFRGFYCFPRFCCFPRLLLFARFLFPMFCDFCDYLL
jgi:hypothetical protein